MERGDAVHGLRRRPARFEETKVLSISGVINVLRILDILRQY
jgi:hypothetical protein